MSEQKQEGESTEQYALATEPAWSPIGSRGSNICKLNDETAVIHSQKQGAFIIKVETLADAARFCGLVVVGEADARELEEMRDDVVISGIHRATIRRILEGRAK